MTHFSSWLGRKKMSLCILAGICSVSLCVIIASGEKTDYNAGSSFVVKIKHYGLNAAEIERSISIPLEDSLSAIAGVQTVQSSSENNNSRVFIRFDKRGRGRYEAVRDAVQRVYESLPSSVQRPEILSSGNSRIPVWSAAVLFQDGDDDSNAARVMERIIKPRLESIEGAGEVFVSGTGLKEIEIILDQEKLAALGLDQAAVAAALAMNDALFSGGVLVRQGREIIVTVDGRYDTFASFDGLAKALIPLGGGRAAALSEIAMIAEQERMPETLSRLNGKKAVVISIMGNHDADLRRLSKNIKKELAALPTGVEFIVLSDLGAEEAAAFRSVFNAALLGAFLVAMISFFLNRKKAGNTALAFNHAGFFCALIVPSICLISTALLSICGFPANRLVLAGIAAGVGTAVDSVILCTEKLRKCRSYRDASGCLAELRSPLIAGAMTTVIVLLPLSAIDGTGVIAFAIAAVTLTALVISLTLLPPLLLWGMGSAKSSYCISKQNTRLSGRVYRRFLRILCRFIAAEIRLCVRYPIRVLLSAFLLAASAVVMFFVKGVDTGSYGSGNSVYAQVEFEGGLLAEEADRILADYGGRLAAQKGIKNVETSARTGSGSVLISFDPRILKAHDVRELAGSIPVFDGFIFFPENSAKDRHWEIRVSGDEEQKCRELAEELAHLSTGLKLIRGQVLNFKSGSKKLLLSPDREMLAAAGIVFSSAAGNLRMGVHGPVVYKRVNSEGEVDVRLRTGGCDYFDKMAGVMRMQTRDDALGSLVFNANSETNAAYQIKTLMKTREEVESASIRRVDRRRTASITVTTSPMDPRRVKQSLGDLYKYLELPPGYSIVFDQQAISQAEALTGTVLSLVLAVVFCYMVIAAINESFVVPLIVLSAIPPSLAVPGICIVLTGGAFSLPAACAFIAVSGMTVNAAVLCIDGIRSVVCQDNSEVCVGFYRVIRQKMPALLATTGTTIAGALPFLFLSEDSNTLIRTLSLVGALGVASSCFCAISIVPAFSLMLRKYLKPVLQKNIPLVRKKKLFSECLI
ncbi:MAG: efflux RND transporter permease subunit [Treponema sp.]|nr:efflux RND transporter permease subunit [Treponema sp.]